MLVDAGFQSVLVLYKMFSLDWVLTLIALIPMLLIILWGGLVEKFMALKWKNRQEQFDNLYDYAQESFTGIRVIKAFVKETQQIHQFAKIAKKNQDTNIDFVRVSVIFDIIISLIIAIIMAILLGFGGWFVYSFATNNQVVIWGHEIALEAGDLVTFLGYFDILVWPMMALGQIVSMRSRAKASYNRIANFLAEEEEIKNPENPIILSNINGSIEYYGR